MKKYKGVVSGYTYQCFHWGPQTGNDVIPIRYGYKTLDEALPSDKCLRVTRQLSDVGPIYSWEIIHLDDTNRYGNGINAPCAIEKRIAFENCEFDAKLQIGEPYKTASSCGCTVYHPEFECCMFLHNLWPMLHTITFDTSDPDNVKKYIEGKFTFEKKGKVVALTGVQ